MKTIIYILLIVLSMTKEIEMPNVVKDDVVVKAPAWLGNSDKFAGSKAQGGARQQESAGDVMTSAISAANTQGGGQWLAMNGEKPAQPAYVNPPKPKQPAWMPAVIDAMAAANTQGGGQWISMNGEKPAKPAYVNPQVPAWLLNMSRPPAYGGHYDTTVNNPAHPSNQQPVQPQDTYDSYQGQPVDDSMSDILRSLEPVQLGSGEVSMSDYLRNLEAGSPYLLPPAWMQPGGTQATGTGMGSRYGGNWKRGGSYGGGNWNSGGGNSPAWANNEMGLFSWKY